MMVEKINEVSRINLASRKSLNITINAGKNPFRTNIRSNVTFYLTCLMKIKCLFSGTIKKRPKVKQVEPLNWKYYCRQRYTVRVCWLLYLNLALGCTVFANSAYAENLAFLYEVLSILATKKNVCS